MALAEGGAPRAVAEALVDAGVPEVLAVREVATIADALAPLIDRSRRMGLILRMLETVSVAPVERRELCGAEEFFARYFSVYRPTVFTGGCAELSAARWSFADLRARFGARELEVGVPPERVRVDAAVDRWLGDAPPEFYLVSQNRALDGALAELRDELAPLPEFLDPDEAPRTANVWIGPRGTVSPLHHDTTHVYFCQLVGRKRYELVAPWEPASLDAPIVRGWDSGLDIDAPDLQAKVHRVDLDPGDALFIPTGWWHRVTALTPSISASLRSFRWDTDHRWYAPGLA